MTIVGLWALEKSDFGRVVVCRRVNIGLIGLVLSVGGFYLPFHVGTPRSRVSKAENKGVDINGHCIEARMLSIVQVIATLLEPIIGPCLRPKKNGQHNGLHPFITPRFIF